MLKTRVFDHLSEIDPRRWDAAGDDPLSTHAVLSALERAELPGVQTAFALLEDGRGRVAAACPFARIEVDAGLLTHGFFRRAIGMVRRVDPRFMHTALCLSGTPLSVGNPPLRLAAGADARRVWTETAGLAGELADGWGAPWRVVKELAEPAGRAGSELRRAGWMVAPSEPNLVLPVRWATFDDYLHGLRHPYRHRVLKSARKLSAAGVQVDVVPLAEGYDDGAHALYRAVLERAEVRLETLTARFFVELGRRAGTGALMFRFRREGRLVGWVAVLASGDRVIDLFHGIDYGENPAIDLYFNQLSAAVRFAVESGARSLSLGQSTETAKVRFGARPRPLWFGLRHRSATITSALRNSGSILFPSRPVPECRTFGTEAARHPVASC